VAGSRGRWEDKNRWCGQALSAARCILKATPDSLIRQLSIGLYR
jgi:hypothetical protein